jgi:HEPN domain-containing protein
MKKIFNFAGIFLLTFIQMDTENIINVDKIKKHWTDTSDNDYSAMLALLEARQYSWALFMGHIVIEKLLKAYYVQQMGKHAPLIHDLLRIAELSGLSVSDEQSDWLDTITKFNINARYDDYKRAFYALCTAEYTAEWAEKIKQIRLWIKQQL